MPISDLAYTDIPERTLAALAGFAPDSAKLEARLPTFTDVTARPGNVDGDTETLDGVQFTHHFVEVDGDIETVTFHYVECGNGEAIVFLHGVPDSWYQWHHQMAALADRYRCIAFDLKGYGQSSKEPGDYRHEAAADQLLAAIDHIGVDTFNLVGHDRGTVQGDYIAAKHPDRVLRYARGEQHLFHFNPKLAPQAAMFHEAPWSGLMNDIPHFVVWLYTLIGEHDLPDEDMRRTIQEFSYPGIDHSVPRYFHSQTFRQEWIDRRTRLLPAWRAPILIVQGKSSMTQPHEFYQDARDFLPNAQDVDVVFIDAGHFWSMERPSDVTRALESLLAKTPSAAATGYDRS